MKSYGIFVICVLFIGGKAVDTEPSSSPNSTIESWSGSAAPNKIAARTVKIPTNRNFSWYILFIKQCLAQSCPHEILQEVISIIENKAVKLNPVDPIVVEVFKNEVKEANEIGKSMVQVSETYGNDVEEQAKQIWEKFYESIEEKVTETKQKFENMTSWDKAKLVVKYLANAIKETVLGAIKALASCGNKRFSEGAKCVGEKVVDGFKFIAKKAFDLGKDVLQSIGNDIVGVFNGIKNAVKELGKCTKHWNFFKKFKCIGGKVVQGVAYVGKKVIQVGKTVVNTVVSVAKVVAGAVKEAWNAGKKAAQAIVSGVVHTGNQIWSAVVHTGQKIWSGVRQFGNRIVSGVKKVGEKIASGANKAWNWLKGLFGRHGKLLQGRILGHSHNRKYVYLPGRRLNSVRQCRPYEVLGKNNRCIRKKSKTGYYKHRTHIYHERRPKASET